MVDYISSFPPDSYGRDKSLLSCIRVKQGYEYTEGESGKADKLYKDYKIARLKTKGDKNKLRRKLEEL